MVDQDLGLVITLFAARALGEQPYGKKTSDNKWALSVLV